MLEKRALKWSMCQQLKAIKTLVATAVKQGQTHQYATLTLTKKFNSFINFTLNKYQSPI